MYVAGQYGRAGVQLYMFITLAARLLDHRRCALARTKYQQYHCLCRFSYMYNKYIGCVKIGSLIPPAIP